MKKIITILLSSFCVLLLTACASGKETDYVSAIMVDGVVYVKTGTAMPAEVDESAIIGYTESYSDTYPEKDGETNFNRELGMPYAKVEGGIAVLFENEWYLCAPLDSTLTEGTLNEITSEQALKIQETIDGIKQIDAGTIIFYSEPTEERTEPVSVETIQLSSEQIREIKNIIDGAKEWDDDYAVDREAYYYDGEIKLPDSEFIYYFTDEYNVIYYDHYFAEISHEYMEYIMGLSDK